jgi:hypothetical protein
VQCPAACRLDPQDREFVNFELWLTPAEQISTSTGQLHATLLYHLTGEEPGELPLVRQAAAWRLLAWLTETPVALRFGDANSPFQVLPSGAVRGSAPALVNEGAVYRTDDFQNSWLVRPEFVSKLREAAADPDAAFRRLAVWALGALRDDRVFDMLISSLHDLRALITLRDHPDRRVRTEAAYVRDHISSPEDWPSVVD